MNIMNIININSKKWVLTSLELNQLYLKKLSYNIEKIVQKYIKKRFGKSWFTLLKSVKYYKNINFNTTSIKLTRKLGSGNNATVYSYKNFAVKKIVSKKYDDTIITGKSEAQIIDYLNNNIVLTGFTPCIIWLYQYENIKTVDYLVLEKMDISFWDFSKRIFSELELKGIIFQVLFTLSVLQEKIPGFRHNDLKIDNILLNFKAEPLQFKFKKNYWRLAENTPIVKISDFDYSFVPGKIINPKVLLAQKNDFGCSKEPSIVYDTHLFLNSVYKHYRKYTNVAKWIKKNFSELGDNSLELEYGRLKNPEKWENVYPSPLKLLNSSFFKEFKTDFNKLESFWGL